MHKHILISIIIITFCFAIFIAKDETALPSIAYFPLDEQTTFPEAFTTINKTEDKDTIAWSVESKSNEEVYLRQDVSLLFENGKVIGVLSKWKQETAHIKQTADYRTKQSSLIQAITFHHGEIHYPNGKINSMQLMTADTLYYVDDDESSYAFHTPTTMIENKWRKKLMKETTNQLHTHWQDLINNFKIKPQKYLSIPLTELVQYEQMNLPNRSEKETKQIIGKLWEGLYKNYIVPLAYNKKNETTNYIPLIMLAKDESHLVVIYELEGEKQQLLQQIP